ncbi:helix-turn-helix domain protein [Kordia sp. SMS9]|uniref:helix-turn-helix domain-containing protein n=1 Tax=Kordia sp. SMS9 TaxID=2282170 RepID=UPI000E0CD573|nr:helix-turn-helix domain-containing protein [Kordia sp. SMS9]AXG72145.1 helix-turn-helix domain protein [Kordia sp. SMS9]
MNSFYLHRNSIFILLFFTIFSYSQNNTTSYITEYNNIYLKNPDDAIVLCDQLINAPESDKKAFGFAGKAYVYVLRANFDLADTFFTKAIHQLALVDEHKTEIEGYIFYFQSLRYLESQELETAIHIMNNTINSCGGNCSPLLEIKLQSALGRLYSLSDKLLKAIEISKACLDKIKNAPNYLTDTSLQKEYLKESIHLAHRNMNVYIYKLNDKKYESYLDSTQHYTDVAKKYAKKHQISYYDVNISTLYGDINFYRNDYKVAKQHYEEVLKVYKERKRNKRVAQVLFVIAECDYFLKNWKPAAATFLQQINDEVWTEYQLIDFEALCHFYLFKIYEHTEQPQKALQYANSYAKKIKEHLETKNASDISMNTLIEYEKREKEVSVFRENYQHQKKQKYVYLYLLLISLVLIATLITCFFKVKRRNKRNMSQLHLRIAQLQQDVTKQHTSKTSNSLTDENALKLIEKLKKLEKEQLFLQPNYTLAFAAKKLNTNSSYLSQTVNNYLNLTFSEYSNRLRIQSIVQRLKEQKQLRNYTIEALAKEAGYKSIGSFNTNFKKLLKVKPSQYINELKRNDR